MDVIFRSVVGKLWMTIIALFALVLTIFSLLIVQSFENYYFLKQVEDLEGLAKRLSENVQLASDKQLMLDSAAKVGSVYRTGLVVVDQERNIIVANQSERSLPQISLYELVHAPALELSEALAGRTPEPDRVIFPEAGEGKAHMQILAVAVPLEIVPGEHVAFVMYQAIEDFYGTLQETRKLIFVVGVIAFILTTVFAFFLSSRITFPLRQMKQTAQRIAEGDFHAEIEIRTTDEIGDLASTFNTMAAHLNGVVHALSHEKEQLASVLRTMVDGVIMVDADGRMVLTNPPADNFLRDWEYEYKETPSPLYDLYRHVVWTGQQVNEDSDVQGRNWSIVMTPLYDHEHIRGAVAVIRDMTRERKLDKLRQDFVANVSHELRTPLSMLQGYSEAIVDDIAATPEEHKELAQIIYDESVRMSKLVNELLDLARIEAGHTELNRERIELRTYLEKIHRKFSGLARERTISLQLEVSTDIEAIVIDPDRMEQVLTNLVDNAMRHTPTDGVVTIQAVGKSGVHTLELAISDTGSGIPQEDLPFVFERFYKADKARTRGIAGTGLGLAIARNIVAAHDGQIIVQSKVGEGTTFTIKLPI